MEAMRVPRPPRFTPVSSAAKSSVKPDSRSAAGTLLMTWLTATPAISSLPETTACKSSETAGSLPMFPVKMKNPTNVRSRL